MAQDGVRGITFDYMEVTPVVDARLYNKLFDGDSKVLSSYDEGMPVIASGRKITVGLGMALIKGRLVQITKPVELDAQANQSSGYVCITIDLNEENQISGKYGSDDYSAENNQVKVELRAQLVQEDVNNQGKVYTFPIATYTTNQTTATVNLVSQSYEKVFSKGEVLWRGTALMHGSQTVQPSKKIWETKNGFLLVWLPYKNGAVVEDRYVTTPFYKERIMLTNVLGEVISGFNDYEKKWFNKRINFDWQTNIFSGYSSNASGDKANMVLRYIISF